jgi:flagellar protein FlaG
MSDPVKLPAQGLPAVRPEPARPVQPPTAMQKTEAKPAPLRAEPNEQASARPPFDPAVLRKEIEEAVERINEQMRQEGRALAFSVDRKSSQTVITVKNSQTGEVVRQIPDETLLKVAHSIEDMKGMLYDEVT